MSQVLSVGGLYRLKWIHVSGYENAKFPEYPHVVMKYVLNYTIKEQGKAIV